LRIWSRQTLKALTVPGAVLLGGVAIAAHAGWLALPPPAIHFIYYCALLGGMLLAWRFHSRRTFVALFVLFLAEQVLSLNGARTAVPGTPEWTALMAVAVLLPANFILIGLMQEGGLAISSLGPPGLLLFVQIVIVTVLYRSAEGSPHPSGHVHRLAETIPLPGFVLVSFALAGIFLLGRAVITRKPADSAQFWGLSSFYLSLRFLDSAHLSAIYAAAAACILATSIIENSYLLAYHDELTGLPSRRAFNDALSRLQDPYCIAVVDIDHFKRFNDTYGHDTGDQVLCLVAAKLAGVTGGGQAYRCGGEEFSILFPGKLISDVLKHLASLRATIEAAEFRMRHGDRRQTPRGPDRRQDHKSSRGKKGHAIRRLAQSKSAGALSVTVSIGVATCSDQNSHADLVLQAADKALYRAKEGGRNRVEAAPSGTKVKAAGIA
jgi:diguanylate cyclase (GGDEF)-like protein